MKFLSPNIILAAATLIFPAALHAQLNSSQSSVTINATLPETLSLSASPGSLNLTLVPGGVATATTPIAITTSWVLAQGRANVSVDAFFSSASAALSGGSPVVNIPSSAVLGLMSTGLPTSYTAFAQSTALGTAAAGLGLFSQLITSSTRNSSRSDSLTLQVNLTSQPQLPAGVYTGALILQAEAL